MFDNVMKLCVCAACVFASSAVSQTTDSVAQAGGGVAPGKSHASGAQARQECVPPCRAGFACLNGNCVSACNPPCPEGMTCNRQSECVSTQTKSEVSPGAKSIPKKTHRHTGLFLSMSAGAGGSSMTSKPLDTAIQVAGFAVPLSFAVGGAVRENVILFGSFDMNRLERATVTRNGATVHNGYGKTTLSTIGVGAGARYYHARYNAFGSVAATISMATVSVYTLETDQQPIHDYTSDAGIGFVAKIGKEWWVSNRWALGGAFVYSLGYGSSGNLFDVKSKILPQNYGAVFSATFN